MRAEYRESQELESRGRQISQWPPLDPPLLERLAIFLGRFEAGNLDAWWHLNMELTLETVSKPL
jgi:hypothetical protein